MKTAKTAKNVVKKVIKVVKTEKRVETPSPTGYLLEVAKITAQFSGKGNELKLANRLERLKKKYEKGREPLK